MGAGFCSLIDSAIPSKHAGQREVDGVNPLRAVDAAVPGKQVAHHAGEQPPLAQVGQKIQLLVVFVVFIVY
jgi:hypothetical protein